jgi:lipid-binding SYLF domain-containing protein
MITRRSIAAAAVALSCAFGTLTATAAHADQRSRLTAKGVEALSELEASDKRANYLAHHARAILIFPSILKAGLVFGGETGNGVLLSGDGKPMGYYNLSGGSWGLQIGGQDFAYALFFMHDGSLHYLHRSDGWAIGTGPSITVINAGVAGDADSTTLTHDVYAFPFNGKGLMADLTLQGTKITRIHPK